MTCVKYLLFAFNLLFFLVGLILIIAGAVVRSSLSEYLDIVGDEFNGVAVVLIIIGVVIFVIGFFGCCGAWKQNYCMIMTFAALLVIIFIVEIAAGIAGFALQGKVEEVVKKGLQNSLDKYDNSTALEKTWDDLQTGLECCGVNGYADWDGKLGKAALYPKSCCADQSKVGCGVSPQLAYQEGCMPRLDEAIRTNLQWIGVVAIIVALLQIVGIVFACCLGRAVRKEYDVV